jgi:hypothetical protein
MPLPQQALPTCSVTARGARRAGNRSKNLCIFVRLGVCAAALYVTTACSTTMAPQASQPTAQAAACGVPGHFCQTFFGP